MNFLSELLSNKPLLNATLAFLLSQLIKYIISIISGSRKNIHDFFCTGGMPSSHSAAVTAMSASIGLSSGWGSVPFAISCVFSSVVVYDATHIRQAAGKNAGRINQVVTKLADKWEERPEELMTNLGHTIPEVATGIILGVFLALLSHEFL